MPRSTIYINHYVAQYLGYWGTSDTNYWNWPHKQVDAWRTNMSSPLMVESSDNERCYASWEIVKRWFQSHVHFHSAIYQVVHYVGNQTPTEHQCPSKYTIKGTRKPKPKLPWNITRDRLICSHFKYIVSDESGWGQDRVPLLYKQAFLTRGTSIGLKKTKKELGFWSALIVLI